VNIVIAGGGTGGHVFPAIAVAGELRSRMRDVRVVFVGTTRGLESRAVPREGYEIRFIRSEGLVGMGPVRTLRSAFMIPLSLKDSFGILRELRPSAVIGVGGYSSGPVVFCARLMNIPTMIHEQNIMPGLTNRILGRMVDAVAVTYHESTGYFPAYKISVTGNPVRKDIDRGSRERGLRLFSLDDRRFTVFVFGGSRGAARINKAMAEALGYMDHLKDRIQILHQTGEQDYEAVKRIYMTHGFRGTVIPFAHEMADAYAVADLVISRAGATTLAELTACGKAAVLVPYPYAAAQHQEINARKLVDMGAARMILDQEINGRRIAGIIERFLDNPDELREMETISRSLGNPGASAKIADIVEALIKKKAARRPGAEQRPAATDVMKRGKAAQADV
jgi:UDP-N-acetylglucosamine--N-acetylmuramyl-(pentapeptide) pyrophosphoryl-undecaprenol N-acetylglucosamine transferase